MAHQGVPMNTYNPRGDAAKLLSYRPNGAIVTDEDGAFLAVRPIILNPNSFDETGKFVADDFTIGYLRRIGQEMSAIQTVHDSISDNQKKLDFMNDAISLKVAPLVDRIRFGCMNGDSWSYMLATVTYVNTAGGVHPVLHSIENPATAGIDLTTMAKLTT